MPDLQPQTSAGSAHEGVLGTAEPRDDALAGLRKMSTTAGLGSGDYVAINNLAIASTLLGLGSMVVPVLGYDLLQVIPLAAIVTALVAWHQIRLSNGTQTGKGLAAAGIVLALLIGGGALVAKAVTAITYAPQTREIAAMVQTMGSEIAQAGAATPPALATTQRVLGPALTPPDQIDRMIQVNRHYRKAYSMFSDKFRSRVSEDRFIEIWSQVNRSQGGVASIEWNGHIVYTTDTGSGAPQAVVMAWLRLNNSKDVLREGIVFTKEIGKWEIDDIPNIFAEPKPRKPAP